MKRNITTSINQKGGVGKSTSVFILAQLLSVNCKVLCLDLDPQKANLSLAFQADREGVCGAYELFKEDGIETKDCIQSVQVGEHSIDIIAANSQLSRIVGEADWFLDYKVKNALNAVRDDYDYIFIDTPPALSTLTRNALIATDWVIIPAIADLSSIEVMAELLRNIGVIKANCNPGLEILGALLIDCDLRQSVQKDVTSMLEDFCKKMDMPLFDTRIPSSVRIKEARDYHVPLLEFSLENKKNKAIAECFAFAEELKAKLSS